MDNLPMGHIFISYSTKNKDYANKLANKLRDEGFDVWIDNDKLKVSQQWWTAIVEAIWSCDAFIVLLTSHSHESRWVMREILIADKREKHIFPLLLDGDFDSKRFPSWEIFVGTQLEDVRNANFPSSGFYTQLAQHTKRNPRRGQDVTSVSNQTSSDTELLKEVNKLPPKSEFTGLNKTRFIIFAIILMIVVMIVVPFALQQTYDLTSTQVSFAQTPPTNNSFNTTLPLVFTSTPDEVATLNARRMEQIQVVTYDYLIGLTDTATLFTPTNTGLPPTENNRLTPEAEQFYVCVQNNDAQNTEDYLLAFRDTTSIGLVFPEETNLTVLSLREVFVSTYTITTDAETGGYRPLVSQTTTITTTDNANTTPRPCEDNIVYEDLRVTSLLFVSPEMATLIKVNGETPEPPQFLGVYAFQFIPSGGQIRARFQVVQLESSPMELSLPFYNEPTPYLVIANKVFAIRQSFAEDTNLFSVSYFAEDRPIFSQILGLNSLSLFDIMSADNVHIYPLVGTLQTYTPMGYIRLEMPSGLALREPQFEPGDIIRPIDGDTIEYRVVSDPTLSGIIGVNDYPQVIEINEDGQLVVQVESGVLLTVDAWLVEVCSDCQ
jgi:hypothetical protein